MIYADPPRRYRKRGKSWSHLTSPDPLALDKYAREHGLKRKHRHPWIHYDVTAEELGALPGVHILTRTEYMKLMRPHRQPRKHAQSQEGKVSPPDGRELSKEEADA